jgi:hypothetical protein
MTFWEEPDCNYIYVSQETAGRPVLMKAIVSNVPNKSRGLMGRHNTSSKSICRSFDSQSRSRALIQTEQLPCLVLIEYSWTDWFPPGSIVGLTDGYGILLPDAQSENMVRER